MWKHAPICTICVVQVAIAETNTVARTAIRVVGAGKFQVLLMQSDWLFLDGWAIPAILETPAGPQPASFCHNLSKSPPEGLSDCVCFIFKMPLMYKLV